MARGGVTFACDDFWIDAFEKTVGEVDEVAMIQLQVQSQVQTRIEHDEPCVGCQYNLRGLKLDDLCPECGKLAADSVRGDGWEQAPERWVENLRRGAVGMRLSFGLLLIGLYPGVIRSFAAAWRLTRRRPEDDENWMKWKKRSLARWITAIGVVLSVGATLFSVLWVGINMWQPDLFTMDASWLDGLWIGAHVTYAMGLILLFDYVRTLGHRVPDGVLVAATTRVWRQTAGMLVGVAIVGLMMQNNEMLHRWLPIELGGLIGKFARGSWLGSAGGSGWWVIELMMLFGLAIWWWLKLKRWADVLVVRLQSRQGVEVK